MSMTLKTEIHFPDQLLLRMTQGGNVAMHAYVQLLSRKEDLYVHSSVLYVQVSTGFCCEGLDGSGVYNMQLKVLCLIQVNTGL
jgi:hypothetical protein